MTNRTLFALTLITIVGCGSEQLDKNPPVPTDDPPTTSASDAGRSHRRSPLDFRLPDSDAGSTDSVAPITDAGQDVDGESDVNVDASTCLPSIGHCLTNMATRCYETSFDDTSGCALTGMSSGWSTGPCELTRSTGGCLIGCDLTYSYRLGGYDPDDLSRAATKTNCELLGGTFVDTSDAGTP